MPTFSPSVVKTAVATLRNPKSAGFDYTGSLYMGTDLVEMSRASFRIEAGQEKQVSFPVTMPSAPGTYPVDIGVFSVGSLLALYKANEDVIIQPLFEYCNVGDNGDIGIFGPVLRAQVFTPLITHKITRVKLCLFRTGTPDGVGVNIMDTVDGHPYLVVCSGSTDGSTLPTGPPYEWREIRLGSGYNLLAGTKYAIAVFVLGGDVVNWRFVDPGTYTRGSAFRHEPYTEDWYPEKFSFMFEEWGE